MKRVTIIAVISLIISFSSPFIFKQYLEKKPLEPKDALVFGGPIPFAEQKVELPQNADLYPLEVQFQSPFEQTTKIHFIPFVFTFICFFLLIFAIYTVFASYFKKSIKKKNSTR
ncbi:MAG: hypothetical protein ABF649_05400 [Bacillus sp. (in: firmicutes)]